MKDLDRLGDVIEGERCPRCRGVLVYNGNYFCIDCDWAYSGRGRLGIARLLAGLIKTRRKLGRNTEREELYLPLGHELRTHERTP